MSEEVSRLLDTFLEVHDEDLPSEPVVHQASIREARHREGREWGHARLLFFPVILLLGVFIFKVHWADPGLSKTEVVPLALETISEQSSGAPIVQAVEDEVLSCPKNCGTSVQCNLDAEETRDAPGFKYVKIENQLKSGTACDNCVAFVDLKDQPKVHFILTFILETLVRDRGVSLTFKFGGHVRNFHFDWQLRTYREEVVLPGGEVPEFVELHASALGEELRLRTLTTNFRGDSIEEEKPRGGGTSGSDFIPSFRMTLLTIEPEAPIPGRNFVFTCDENAGAGDCKVPFNFVGDHWCDCTDCSDETEWFCGTCAVTSTTTSTTSTSTSSSSTTSTSLTSTSTSSSSTTSTSLTSTSTSSSSTTSTSSTSTSTSSSSTTSTSSTSTSTSSSSTTSTSSTSTSTSSTSTSSSSTSSSSSTTSSVTTVPGGPSPPPVEPPPPSEDAEVAAAVTTGVAGALGIALGIGLGLAPALAAVFVANGQITLSVPDPQKFERDDRAQRALKRSVAELAGPLVTEAAVTLAFGCIASSRVVPKPGLPPRRLKVNNRWLQQMLDICFQVELQGEETGEEVCQRLSSFDSSVAARIINRYLAEEGLDPSAVEVVRWNADPNPTASNPVPPVAPGDTFRPPSSVNFG